MTAPIIMLSTSRRPHDPRPELAQSMLDATAGADKLVVYSGYEKRMIRELQAAVRGAAGRARVEAFRPFAGGSDDLVIVDGQVASVEIARLLFVAHKVPVDERDRVLRDLLEYCKRDTWATMKLVERLRELAVG